MRTKKAEHCLTTEEIDKGTSNGLDKYKGLGFLERYALFMGVVQILELQLKRLLVNLYNYDFDEIEKWTLGSTYRELDKNGLRKDFLTLLKNTLDNRNYIAHELLVNKFVFHEMLGDKTPAGYYDKETRKLDKSIYELEHLIFLFEWTNSKNGWN